MSGNNDLAGYIWNHKIETMKKNMGNADRAIRVWSLF